MAGISKKLRFEVFKRDAFTCQYCGRKAPEVVLQADHVTPRCASGKDSILNLVTACQDCNGGKAGTALQNGTFLASQRAQIESLNTRREQLKMMAKWQEELLGFEDEQITMLEQVWRQTVPYDWTSSGRENVKRVLKKFGFCETSEAIRTATNTYLVFQDGKPTLDSAIKAMGKIGGVAYTNTLDEDEKEIRYIANILVKRTHYSTKWKLWELLRQQGAEHPSVPWDRIRSIAGGCRNFGDFEVKLAALNAKEASHA